MLSLTNVINLIGMSLTKMENIAVDILFNFLLGFTIYNYLNIYFIHLRIGSKIEIFKWEKQTETQFNLPIVSKPSESHLKYSDFNLPVENNKEYTIKLLLRI